MESKDRIFVAGGYVALISSGIWSVIKGDYGVAALIFFGFAVFAVSSLPVGDDEIDSRARENMPDAAEIRRYREQNSGTSITDAINSIVGQRHQ
jgi:hypothetical protein